MNSTTILHEAEVELWEAVAYYEARSTGLGLDFEAEVETSVAAVRDSPERWPVRPDGTRRYLTPRFSHTLWSTSIFRITSGSSRSRTANADRDTGPIK